MPIAIVAISILGQLFSGGAALREAGRDASIASTAAQTVVEEMRNEDFRQVFALYNADPLDDPNGPGTAPGNTFVVQELARYGSDPTGVVGEIILPAQNFGSEVVPDWQIREDVVNEQLGTPRDLNGDAVVDDRDHTDNYTLLPVVVVLRWETRYGPQEFRLFTVLTELYR